MDTAHKNLWKCGYAHKIKPVQIPAGLGEGLLEPHHQLSSYGQLFTAEGTAVGKLPAFLWVAPHLYMYGPHQLALGDLFILKRKRIPEFGVEIY